MTRSKRALWLLLTIGLVSLDLWSKSLWDYPAQHGHRPIVQKVVFEGWFQIRTVWNTGGVWSLPIAATILLWATILAIPFVVIWMFWPDKTNRAETAAKALILGGAVGNLYDRASYGAVRDFLDVYFGGVEGWHWPTFNLADMALVCGIGLLLLMGVKPEKKQEAAA